LRGPCRIILVDQIDRDIAEGHSQHRAIVDATVRRARPVLLTALAAILGMIPLAGSVFWGPMAITIMGGLFVATLLTLLVVPALYALWFRVRIDQPEETAVASPQPTKRRSQRPARAPRRGRRPVPVTIAAE
jgi:Cu/Ag efflux pump CusA